MTYLCHYSLIQYCPVIDRAEALNIGIILFCSVTGEIESRFSHYAARIGKVFPAFAYDDHIVSSEIESIRAWVNSTRGSLLFNEFSTFIESIRNGLVRSTPLRIAKFQDAQIGVDALCERLVDSNSEPQRNPLLEVNPFVRELDFRFSNLLQEGRIELDSPKRIPGYDRAMNFNYHFRDEVDEWALVQSFSGRAGKILDDSAKLAFRGKSLFRSSNGAHRMIVIINFDEAERQSQLESQLVDLFSEEHCDPITEKTLGRFVERVQKKAVPIINPRQEALGTK